MSSDPKIMQAVRQKPVRQAHHKDLKPHDEHNGIVIAFDHVFKTYHLYQSDRARFLGLFGIRRKGGYLGSIQANDDLSFIIKRGEAVALIGQNGAGKSTVLKIITGVVYPTSGTVSVNGRVSALLELNVGFDNQLTGRENVSLRGQALGLTREEISELEPKIIDFADLGVYIDQPMRTYSSGMRARLGFGFAVSVNPEILIIDEVLSVGDQAFRRKCVTRIREIMQDEKVTVLFVAHASETAKEFCTRGIVLDHGSKVFDGMIDEAVSFYESMLK